jgi:hypothetical protein
VTLGIPRGIPVLVGIGGWSSSLPFLDPLYVIVVFSVLSDGWGRVDPLSTILVISGYRKPFPFNVM